MNADGSNQTRLTNVPGKNSDRPNWQRIKPGDHDNEDEHDEEGQHGEKGEHD